jgi:predicted O-linked N-acetylglucosamine transferase (SPINDLY family)
MARPAPPPSPADALRQAVELHRSGQVDAARALYAAILAADPRQADALHLMGVAEHQLGRPASALDWFDRALAIAPALADAHANRGAALRDLREPRQALASLDRALALVPRHAVALNNRGAVLLDLGRPREALDDIEQSLRIAPGQPLALYNRATALVELGRDREALAACNAALAALPGHPELLNHRGNLLRAQGSAQAALDDYDHALRAAPGHVAALVNRGHALADLGRHEAARDSYERAYVIAPDMPYLPGHLLHASLRTAHWSGLDDLAARIRRELAAGHPACEPFVALLAPLAAAHRRRCAELHATRVASASRPPAEPLPAAAGAPRPLRIGYFSADFHDHPTARLAAGVLEAHDRARVEVLAFAFGPRREDAMRARLRAGVDHFIDVAGCCDQEIVELARAIGIDIAVDLGGWTRASRGGVFARRAAPIQAAWLGFAGTTGAPEMDYLIADDIVAPPGCEAEFSEALARLPDCYQPNDRARPIAPEPPARAALGLPPDGFVFCCFNHVAKIGPQVFTVWMTLLRHVPGSVLWLLEGDAAAAPRLRAQAAAHGVAPERLVFAPRRPAPEHLARHAAADLFLDTWPYNAHTTASDALWAGLPVLTRRAPVFSGRVAASLLAAAGLPELVTDSDGDYCRLALALAHDRPRLDALKRRLRETRDHCPLFDTRRFAGALESLYETMWARHRAGQRPAALRAPDLLLP